MTQPIDAFARAAAAYGRASLSTDAAPPAAAPAGPSFAAVLRDSLDDIVGQQKAAEATAAQAVDGQADLASVITAVAEADATLQAVVAVRDRVIEAYKDIMRMPI